MNMKEKQQLIDFYIGSGFLKDETKYSLILNLI